MAEIILPPEENEETPETPEVPEITLDKPTENSKVITIEFEAKKTNKVSTKDTNQQLYTTDTDAWFEFKETSLEGANGAYSVVFRNRHDGSIFQRTGDVVDGVAYYKIPQQEIRHAGAWRGQIVYTLSNGDTTAREFDYDVKGHILDGKDVREIVVEDFETLMSQLRSMKDSAELELANLTQELRNTTDTAEQNETSRQAFFDDLVEDIDELQANYQELLDTGVLQTNINNKLEQLEEEYAPKLTEVTTQLAHTWKSLESFPRLETENDDTARIKRLIEATNEGETAFIPSQEEWYDISDTIVIDKRIDFISKGKIGYSGERDRSAIKLDRLEGMYFELYKIADGNNASNDSAEIYGGYHGWENINYVGVETVNLKWCTIKIHEIRNFTTGFKANADGGGGYWFNYHYLLNITNNLRNLEINSNGIDSWFNANYFYETTYGYGSSHAPFMNDNRMKYGIIQTLTNGNEYGGNSNIFYDFKFEANVDFPHGFTLIKTVKVAGWRFENYRQELNAANLDFIEVDLALVNENSETRNAHTHGITLKPYSTVGLEHKIKFTNTDKVRVPYPTIASFDNWKDDLHTKLVLNDLHKQVRKTNDNHLIIPNLTFTQNANTDIHHEIISCYGGRIEKDYVHIGTTYPLLVYIENIKKGDTFVVEMDSSNDVFGGFGIESFRSTGEKIEGLEVDGVRPIAFEGYFSNSSKKLHPHSSRREHQFTVNADFVDTIRLNFTGTINNVRVKTDNEKAIVKTTQKDVKPNKLYFNSKPSATVDGGFEVGDTVYSQDENKGWSLENNAGTLTWVEFNY